MDHPRSLALTIVVAYYRILPSRSLTIHVKRPRSRDVSSFGKTSRR